MELLNSLQYLFFFQDTLPTTENSVEGGIYIFLLK